MTRSNCSLVLAWLACLLAACAPRNSMIVTVPPQAPITATQTAPTTGGAASPDTPFATPADTPLPPLELPALEANLPPIGIWDGAPTYPADSAPNTFFRVNFNPHLWSMTQDQYGQIVLAHRGIPYCVITPVSGHGLPAGIRSEREIRTVGALEFEVNLAYQADNMQFAAYYGGTPGELYTGFQVSFHEQSDACLQDAETVLSTLRAIPQAEATPGS